METTISVTAQDDLQKVFDLAPQGATICLSAGVYRQSTLVRTQGLHILGQGMDKTILISDDAREEPPERALACLTVLADDIYIKGLALVSGRPCRDSGRPHRALSVHGNFFRMDDCRLTAARNTLFCGPLSKDPGVLLPEEPTSRKGSLHQRFDQCLIEGSTDLVFGCGNAFFDWCELRSLPAFREESFVAAPAHGPKEGGFGFCNCRFTCGCSLPPQSVSLVRSGGSCVFTRCSYGSHIRCET